MEPMRVAAIQMTSGDEIAANIAALDPLIREAASGGATLVTTPENVFYMRAHGGQACGVHHR